MIVKIDLTNDNSYEIYIEKLKALSFDRKVVVVTNPTVAGFHLEYLKSKLTAKELSVCTIKDGEEYKNMQTLEDILSSCFEAKLDRKSLLIALEDLKRFAKEGIICKVGRGNQMLFVKNQEDSQTEQNI